MFTPFREIQTKYQWLLGVGTLSITDRFSASLLTVEEETFVMVLLENETVSKGGKVRGHQFYWCDYYLYIAGVAKEMIPSRGKQNRPHRSTSRWAPRSHHSRPTGFVFIYHHRPVDKSWLGSLAIQPASGFIMEHYMMAFWEMFSLW